MQPTSLVPLKSFGIGVLALAIESVAVGGTPEAKAIIPASPIESLWEFVVEPYAWMTGLQGTTGALGRTVNVDFPFSDVLSHLDWSAFLTAEARHGRWGIIFDGMLAQLSATGNPSAPNIYSINTTLKQGLAEVDVAYRLAEGTRGTLDAYIGSRYNYISVDTTTTSAGVNLPFLVTNASADKQWADVIVGVRGQYNFNEKWFARGRLDVGGFHIVSNVTFQGSASFGYNFTKSAFAELGYRYLLTEYESGGFSYDLATSGLFMGFGLRF